MRIHRLIMAIDHLNYLCNELKFKKSDPTLVWNFPHFEDVPKANRVNVERIEDIGKH